MAPKLAGQLAARLDDASGPEDSAARRRKALEAMAAQTATAPSQRDAASVMPLKRSRFSMDAAAKPQPEALRFNSDAKYFWFAITGSYRVAND